MDLADPFNVRKAETLPDPGWQLVQVSVVCTLSPVQVRLFTVLPLIYS